MSETVSIYPGWSVRPVAGRIGAEISGVRLDGDLADKTIEDIRRALDRHKVLFFRDQNHLDDDEQEAQVSECMLCRVELCHRSVASLLALSVFL